MYKVKIILKIQLSHVMMMTSEVTRHFLGKASVIEVGLSREENRFFCTHNRRKTDYSRSAESEREGKSELRELVRAFHLLGRSTE